MWYLKIEQFLIFVSSWPVAERQIQVVNFAVNANRWSRILDKKVINIANKLQ